MKIKKIIKHILHEMVVHLVPAFLKKNVLKCSDIHEILSQEKDLSFRTNLKLKFHILICQCCTDFYEQLKIIQNKSKSLGEIELTPEQLAKVKKSQEKIISKIKSS